jgi:hypothetical protein
MDFTIIRTHVLLLRVKLFCMRINVQYALEVYVFHSKFTESFTLNSGRFIILKKWKIAVADDNTSCCQSKSGGFCLLQCICVQGFPLAGGDQSMDNDASIS